MSVLLLPSVRDGRLPPSERLARAVPWAITGTGVSLTFVLLGEWIVVADLRPAVILSADHVVGLLTSGPFIAGLLYGGYRLATGPLPRARYLRIAGWHFVGLSTFLLMNVLAMVAIPPDTMAVFVGWLRWAVAIGGGVGLVIGVIEARAIERERAAERAATRAEYAEAQRNHLEYLNGLLRHEVLNTANVISGGATFLLENQPVDDRTRDWLERIARQSEDMTAVIRDVNVLLEAAEEGVAFEPVDLAAMLRDELAHLEDDYDDVQTDLSAPATATVRADELLQRLFSNLLSNAVEHNDSETPAVSVTVETDGETVRVRISDNGPGIPEAKVDTLFEGDNSSHSTHGLGLYLVDRLGERYGGSVELTATGGEGSTFTVRLPRADADRGVPARPDVSDRASAGVD